LFGASKTLRGVAFALLATALAGPLVGVDMIVGLTIGTAAMAGDLLSSLAKRRLAMPPSSKATGIDQVPESLLPVIACRSALALSVVEIAAVTVIFFVGEVLLARLFYRLHLRDRPY
jgi:CDP-2,3-bis-(O-geranylgeranyl)-sn-glycerol synthase